MSLLNMLTQLACSLFFWPATFHCIGLDRPQTYPQQACACSPCAGNKPCVCMGYPCPQCPCQPPCGCYLGSDGCERIGVDFEQMPAPMPCYPPMMAAPFKEYFHDGTCRIQYVPYFPPVTAAPFPPCQPYPAGVCEMERVPVSSCPSEVLSREPISPAPIWQAPPPVGTACPMPFQVPLGPAPKVYNVKLRFKADADEPCTCPRVSVVEGGDAVVSMNCLDKAGKPCCRTLHLRLGKAQGECVPVHFSMTSGDAGKPVEKMTVEQAVHFDTVTGLVLGGPGPEPCVAELVVTPVKTRMAPPAPLPPPIPAAPKAIDKMARVRAPLPPPAPIAPSPAYCTGEPMFWRLPADPSGISYVPYPLPSFVNHPPMPTPAFVPHPPVVLTSIPVPLNPPVIAPFDAKVYRLHRTSHICVVHESGKAKLQLRKDGVCSTAVRMKLETDEAGCLRFAASKHHVHLTGKMWKASADSVEMYDDGRLILTGHVKVVSDKAGACASLKAQRVCLRVKHGKVEKINGGVFSK
jgi:hypothetical protein